MSLRRIANGICRNYGVDRMNKDHFVSMLQTMRAVQHVVCDSTVVAGEALASLVHALRETEALHGRQVQYQHRAAFGIRNHLLYVCSSCRCLSSTRG
jgi:hypothetical protein